MKTDTGLYITIAAIFFAALLALYSASHQPDGAMLKNFAIQQMVWMGLGLFVAVFIIWFGYERWLDYSYIIFAVNILLLIFVLSFGSVRYGARRWLDVGFFSLQPSEFCKISFILALVKYISDKGENISSLKTVLVSLIMCIIPVLLIIRQPDLGTALVFLPVLYVILFTAGSRIKHLILLFLAGAVNSPVIWQLLKGYQKRRILVFLNPNADPLGAGYTVIQSKIAVGSGGFFGKGWMAGTQNQLNFLPERHTDFIFSVIGEEWGFIGILLLLILFLSLIRYLMRIQETTNDIRGKLLVVGVVTVLWFQIFVNIAMTVGLMPVVGIPLPIISYGGSSLISTIILIALAISVSFRRKVF